MAMAKTFTNIPAKSLIRIALSTALILLFPLVAMMFSSEVDWKLGDFIIMGILIFVTGLALDFTWRIAGTQRRRIAIAALIVLAFLYVWAELAVGIFTNLGS